MNGVLVRKALPTDLDAVATLLRDSSLPTEGVEQHFNGFLVAEMQSSIVGAIGLEVYDGTGLLRSAVVKGTLQNKGIGSMLYDALIDDAKRLKLERLILLTTTAESYFAGKGFRSIERNAVTGRITQSVEFTGACPSQAVCMELILQEYV